MDIDPEAGLELTFLDVELIQFAAAGLVDVDAETNRKQLASVSKRMGIDMALRLTDKDGDEGGDEMWMISLANKQRSHGETPASRSRVSMS